MTQFSYEKPFFSKHAILRMKERKIGIEEVIEALYEPKQLVYDTWKDVYIAVSIRGIAVVYAYRGSLIEILTVLREKEYNALMSKYGQKRYKVIV